MDRLIAQSANGQHERSSTTRGVFCRNPIEVHLDAELLPQLIELLGRDGALRQAPPERLQHRIGLRDLRLRRALCRLV